MKFRWMEEAPTQPGWYWVWPHNHHRFYAAKLDIVIEDDTKQVLKLVVLLSPHGDATDVAMVPEFIHKWAGPIPGPENP